MKIITICAALMILFSNAADANVCVNRKKVNLRAKATTKSQKTWEVHNQTPLKKINRKGKWLEVRDVDGDTHFVHADLVTAKKRCATIKSDAGANAHLAASSSSPLVNPESGNLPKYASFKLLTSREGWVQLEDTSGTRFYVAKKDVWIP